MIIRKPYAFLIKNFRKIHVALLLIGLYILYKTFDTVQFVNRFMDYGIYDLYADPISGHITFWMRVAILLVVAGTIALLFLLLHKKKPWKAYLTPIIVYVLLFFVLGMISSFFRTYTETVDAADLRLSRDLLMIFMVGQLPALGVFVVRIFGLDVKKFDFNSDLEELNLSEEDRAEVEVSFDFDINTIKRGYKRFKRNAGYFYTEHKFITRAVVLLIIGIIAYNCYSFFFVTNKVYKQGDSYEANGYTINVGNAYLSNKDGAGKIISNNSNFVVVSITVKNNIEPRNLDISNFHLLAGTKNYEVTETTYAKEFEDFGTSYKKVKKLKRDESVTFIAIYKVDKEIPKNKFVLCYQEKSGLYKLRQIKLKVKDVSKIQDTEVVALGDYFDVPIYGKEDSLSIDSVVYASTVTYNTNSCTSTECNVKTNSYTAPEGYKIMEITFSSDEYEAKNMIDFLNKYGRINYKDSRGKAKDMGIEVAITKKYFGKKVYLTVPADFESFEEVSLDIIIRDKHYSYQLS